MKWVVIIILSAALTCRATTYYVASSGDDSRTGTGGWTNALATISNGVFQAQGGANTVLVSNGTYNLTATITINAGIIVRSYHDGYIDQTNTIVDGGGGAFWCVSINNSGAVLDGLTITNSGGGGVAIGNNGGTLRNCRIVNNTRVTNPGGGIYAGDGAVVSNCVVAGNAVTANPSGYGGGISVAGYGVRIVDSIISNNISSGSGGGLYISGYADVLNCTITTNTATTVAGGGIYINTAAAGGAVISNCIIRDNIAMRGAGMANGYNTGFAPSAGNVTVVGTRIIGNNRGANSCYGGGVWINTSGTQILDRCEVSGNAFLIMYSAGAGIYSAKGVVDIRNCLVASNRCGPGVGCDGAGIYITTNSTTTVRSCTIVGNETTRSCGGVYMLPANNCGIWNSIIVSNRADVSYADMFGTADYIAPVYYSCSPVLTNVTQGNITNSPDFAAGIGNWRLGRNSPCVNTGTNQSGWMAGALDLDGQSRIDNYSRKVDMGAYEYLLKGTLFFGR